MTTTQENLKFKMYREVMIYTKEACEINEYGEPIGDYFEKEEVDGFTTGFYLENDQEIIHYQTLEEAKQELQRLNKLNNG